MPEQSVKEKSLYLYLMGFIEFVFFDLYVIYIHPYILSAIELIDKNQGGQNYHYVLIKEGWLIALLAGALLAEITAYRFISFKKKFYKKVFALVSFLPRTFLFFELFRFAAASILEESVVFHEQAILWFFLILLLVLIKEAIMLWFLFSEKLFKGLKSETSRLYQARFLALPFVLLWYSIFQETDLVSLVKQVKGGWYSQLFPFIGLYFVFICIPLQLVWMIKTLELKKLTLLNAIAIIGQPAFLFFSLL